MDLVQQIMAKVRGLSLERQHEVLSFVEKLESQEQQRPRLDSYGSCGDIQTNLSFEEFAENRRELWGHATDTELDR